MEAPRWSKVGVAVLLLGGATALGVNEVSEEDPVVTSNVEHARGEPAAPINRPRTTRMHEPPPDPRNEVHATTQRMADFLKELARELEEADEGAPPAWSEQMNCDLNGYDFSVSEPSGAWTLSNRFKAYNGKMGAEDTAILWDMRWSEGESTMTRLTALMDPKGVCEDDPDNENLIPVWVQYSTEEPTTDLDPEVHADPDVEYEACIDKGTYWDNTSVMLTEVLEPLGNTPLQQAWYAVCAPKLNREADALDAQIEAEGGETGSN